MRYALIAPVINNLNPGCHFITMGVKYWLRQLDPTATFFTVDMLQDDPSGWEVVMSQADKLILCGNPRFNGTEAKVFWDWDIWGRINQAIDKGIPFIDAWAGSAWEYSWRFGVQPETPAQITARLLKIKKNCDILKHEARAELLIARDHATEIMFKTVSDKVQLLPCCSFNAAKWCEIESQKKDINAIVIRSMPKQEWLIERLKKIQAFWKPCLIVSTTCNDWLWAKNAGLATTLINDPLDLLHLYSRVGVLHSFRLHASIPALSLGAKVRNFETDSRAATLSLFDIQSVPFTTLR